MSRARPLRIFQAAARPLTLNVAIGPFLEYFVNVVRESYFHGDTKRLLVARCLVPPMLGAYHVRGFAPMFLDCIVPRSRCGRRRVPRYISSSLGNARVRAVPAAYCIVDGAECTPNSCLKLLPSLVVFAAPQYLLYFVLSLSFAWIIVLGGSVRKQRLNKTLVQVCQETS